MYMIALDVLENIQIAAGLIYLIWLYAWAKKQLGSAPIAAIFAVIIVYLTFYLYPWLIWVPIIFFLIATFFSGMFEKIPSSAKKPEHLKD